MGPQSKAGTEDTFFVAGSPCSCLLEIEPILQFCEGSSADVNAVKGQGFLREPWTHTFVVGLMAFRVLVVGLTDGTKFDWQLKNSDASFWNLKIR